MTAYARRRMRQRDISEAAIAHVLKNYVRKRPAPTRPSAPPAEIFIGLYRGRNLKVYVMRGSVPPLVTTVVWDGDE